MSLSCSCGDDDGCAWYFTMPSDFSKLETKRSRKCCSCGTKIKPGDDSLLFGDKLYDDGGWLQRCPQCIKEFGEKE